MRYLLMGGQACILYGAAEFSRDLDIAIAIDNALENDEARLESSLTAEENIEKQKDREYWLPLRKELEQWRFELHRKDK
jgi:hypothetical protein